MKYLLLIVSLIGYSHSNGADLYKLTLRFNDDQKQSFDISFDSLVISNPDYRRKLTTIKTVDSQVIIDSLPYGSYQLQIYNNNYVFIPQKIVVCGACDNLVNVISISRNTDYTFVQIEAGIKNPPVNRHFFKNFTAEEKDIVLSAPDFIVELVVCRSGVICNTFIRDSAKLSDETRLLIQKGISNLAQNITPMYSNADKIDGMFIITSEMLRLP